MHVIVAPAVGRLAGLIEVPGHDTVVEARMVIRGSNTRWQLLMAVAAMGSGAALILTVLTGVALLWSLVLLGIMAVLTVTLRWVRSDGVTRERLRAELATGAIAGLAATAAYDATRFLLVSIGRLPLTPFDTWVIFGQLILGEELPAGVSFLAGAGYHLLNGTAFAIGYCLLLGGRSWKFGVAWGLGLEAAMLCLYPRWLQLDAIIAEFVTMSFAGHLIYGAVLGAISQKRLRPVVEHGAGPGGP